MNRPWVHIYPTISHHPEAPSHLSPHPSPLGCPRGIEYTASCIKLALVICFTYGNIHVSMLFSQIIPPLPSPTESKSLFFTFVSPLLPCMQDCHYRLSKFHICVLIYSICLFLTSLCITGSSFIHLFRTDSNVFFFIAE